MKRVLTDPCIEKAEEDEPAFVLLARDPMASALVRMWVAIRRREIAAGVRDTSELEQVSMAELEAERMDMWRKYNREHHPTLFERIADRAREQRADTADTAGEQRADLVPHSPTPQRSPKGPRPL